MSFWPHWLPFGYVKASTSARAKALESARIGALSEPQGAVTFIAGGRQTKGALPLKTRRYDAAIYSSRGRNYARYNEDAAGLFADDDGDLYLFVLDQAGGLGGRVRGKASEIVATRIFASMRAIATEPDQKKRSVIEGRLLEAFMDAHHSLIQREEGEVTTAVAAVLGARDAIVLNSGDSGALHLRDGAVVAQTTMHEHPPPDDACLTHAIGLVPEGCEPDAYTYPVEAGDWLVLASDGFLDADFSTDELWSTLSAAKDAEDAVNRVCTTILRRMGLLRTKPDNLTFVAAQRRADAPAKSSR